MPKCKCRLAGHPGRWQTRFYERRSTTIYAAAGAVAGPPHGGAGGMKTICALVEFEALAAGKVYVENL
jgi:hypothetical protein